MKRSRAVEELDQILRHAVDRDVGANAEAAQRSGPMSRTPPRGGRSWTAHSSNATLASVRTSSASAVRVSRTFRIGDRLQLEGLLEGFNLTNHENVVTLNGNFGAATYPTSPSSTFGQITAIGDPRSLQFGIRAKV